MPTMDMTRSLVDLSPFFFSSRINTHIMVIKTIDRGANINIWCRVYSAEEGC